MRRLLTVIAAGLSLGAGASCSARYPTAPASRQIVAIQIQYPKPTPDPRVGTSVSFLLYAVNADGAWTDVTPQATWYAADSSVIRTTPGSPTVLAVGEGATNVIATYGGLTDSVPIAVRPALVTYPRLELVNLGGQIVVGSDLISEADLSQQMSATTSSILMTTHAVWTSSNPAVAKVSLNSFTAIISGVAIGTARITATIGGQSISLSASVAPRR